MRKLDYAGEIVLDNGDQTGARGQYSLFLVIPSQSFVQLRNRSSRVEVDSKDFRQFLYTEWANGNGEALKEPVGVNLIRPGYFL
jgi:hypothetical protein